MKMETGSTYKFVNKSAFLQTKVILIQLLDYMSSPTPHQHEPSRITIFTCVMRMSQTGHFSFSFYKWISAVPIRDPISIRVPSEDLSY